jgi:hypothetical protein
MQHAAINLKDSGGQAADHHPIVGDQDQGAAPLEQDILQPVDGPHVQMVGGFVQQQDVRLCHQGSGQQHLPLHAG